jgi:hypothetical protein
LTSLKKAAKKEVEAAVLDLLLLGGHGMVVVVEVRIEW